MKNIYRVTRPAWANMDRSETALILGASILLGVYGGVGQMVATPLLVRIGISNSAIPVFWPLVDVVVVTFGCLLLIRLYKKLRVGCYPATFIYCFYIPEDSNPRGRSKVVGYCQIKPEMETGEIGLEGASFFWENGRLSPDSEVGFTSTQVRGTKEKEDVTCHIRFEINSADASKRFYRYGVLQFRLVGDAGDQQDNDAYAGYLQSMHRDIQDVEVHAKGYAERCNRETCTSNDIQAILAKQGDPLFGRLDALLNASSQPSLWGAKDQMASSTENTWGLQVPSPQSAILNHTLRPHIDGFLNKVLSAFGLQSEAIERFTAFAHSKAKVEENTLVYERELKSGLIGMIKVPKRDEALTQRANLIYEELKPFLIGDSLLDIGCGDGRISILAKEHFSRCQLLDVVQFLPRSFSLPFVSYEEGQPLPVDQPFDTVFLLTVLHHASNPVKLLKLAWKATKKRLIIIESVVGIHVEQSAAKYDLIGLPDEAQIAYAGFVDWFYNRVLYDDVPVPYNFTTPETWQSVFLQHKMPCVKTIHLGQDINIGPEYHVLFILEKPEQPSLLTGPSEKSIAVPTLQ